MTKIWIIKNDSGQVCGIAPSETEARKQVMWFLPKGESYRISMEFIR